MASQFSWKRVTTFAGDASEEHSARGFIDAVATASGDQGPLRFVGTGMAPGAIQLESFLKRDNLVLNLCVALLTLDVVFGDMDFVEEGGVVECIHPLREVVTGPAPLFFGHPITDSHVSVTLRAGYQVSDNLIVIDWHTLVLQVRRGRMATQATAKRLAHRAILEMAEVACGRCDRQVLALNDLRMT